MSHTKADPLTAETLLNLGFVDVASWVPAESGITYRLDGLHSEANRVRFEERNALYAFVEGEDVLYIGKTARTIRKRFTGYCRPAEQQRTNWRCHGKIREALARGRESGFWCSRRSPTSATASSTSIWRPASRMR